MKRSETAPPQAGPWLRRLLGEPFFQFIVLGALIFAVHARFGADAAVYRIDVTPSDLQRLQAMAQQQWGKPADAAELQRLVQEHVREEVLAREALANGLDSDDVIVRRRLVQKMEFLALSDVPLPSEEEVHAYYQAHPQLYGAPPELSFRQLYFKDAAAARQALARLEADPAAALAGERLMLPERFVAQSQSQVARDFGDAFAAQLFELPVGRWSGPLRSPYGLHVLLVEQRMAAQLLEYPTIRAKVAADLTSLRQQEARDAAYAALRSRYQVHVAALDEAGAL